MEAVDVIIYMSLILVGVLGVGFTVVTFQVMTDDDF